ncbi:MAG: hypothetical protein OEW64_06765 [Gammaproteobacteria bacterium]|nr:hypothetical protein [Gammaproteobacteria bacterium]MDH5303782.1 hypothetical protein [Gammaproteobacteria bacterium]MDH5322190.1 hypothetical protein [Gammaproteobacteria bacterium]
MLAILLNGCSAATTDAPSAAEAGRRIYRQGLLPSGEPVTAFVAGDVPVLGTQFSCQSCHGRSGMGASESSYTVPPIAAQFLFVESPQPKRPAYDVQSLARVLRDGVTAGGRVLSAQLMPRYELGDAELVSLAAYLATLSPGNSPGVDTQQIHFATVMTEDVDPGERAAVLAVLNRFAAEINAKTRNEAERWDRGYTPESKLPTAFREWVIEEWTLAGPPSSWDAQLETKYAVGPVFAMLSGLGTGSWRPIGNFCERHEIPCLFPGTALPEAQAGDFYTLYFSRGLFLEADLIAARVAAQPQASIVQVYCDAVSGQAAARLRDALRETGASVSDIAADCNDLHASAEIAGQVAAEPGSALVLWLNPGQLAVLKQGLPVRRVYLSSTLLKGAAPASLMLTSTDVFIAYPYLLPGEADPAMQRFALWAKTRGVELTVPRLQAEAFFACLALNDAMKHMGRFVVRDYMLDILDHAQGLAAYLPFYSRPTFGPGQRFLSKGGYVLPIVNGKIDTDNAQWILP